MVRKKDKELAALGEQIRALREARNISQEDFASHSGISRSFYGRIERGQVNISASYLIKIARHLKVEVGELFPSLSKLDKTKDK